MNNKIAKSELRSIKDFNPLIRKELMKTYRRTERFDRDWLYVVFGFIGMVIAPSTVLFALLISNQFEAKVIIFGLIAVFVLLALWLVILSNVITNHKMIKQEKINYVVYTSTNKCLSSSKYLDKNGEYTRRKCAMFDEHKIELLYDVDYDRLEPGMRCILLCEENNPRFAVIEDLAGIRLSQSRRKLTPREKRIRRSEQIKRSMNVNANKKLVYRRDDDKEITKAFTEIH